MLFLLVCGKNKMPVGDGCFIVGTGNRAKEWRGGSMYFVMGLLRRYVVFTVVIFMVGGIMGYFFEGESIIDNNDNR